MFCALNRIALALCAALALVSLPTSSCGQSTAGAGAGAAGGGAGLVTNLKARFFEEMRKAIAPAGEKYIEELQKLESAYAKAGRYEAAIAAREEREAVKRFLAGETRVDRPVAGGRPDGGSTEGGTADGSNDGIGLVAAAGMVADGAVAEEDRILLAVGGASAKWNLGEDFEPGGYEVFVRYASSAEAEVQAKESFFRLSSTLPDSGGETKTAKLGTLKITSRSDSVSLVHLGDADLENLTIFSVRLVSTKE